MKKSGMYDKTYVNNSYAVEIKEEKKFKLGKNYWDIDFEILNFAFKYTDNMPIIGNLIIGKNKISLTPSECNKIIDTLKEGLNTYNSMVKRGKI